VGLGIKNLLAKLLWRRIGKMLSATTFYFFKKGDEGFFKNRVETESGDLAIKYCSMQVSGLFISWI